MRNFEWDLSDWEAWMTHFDWDIFVRLDWGNYSESYWMRHLIGTFLWDILTWDILRRLSFVWDTLLWDILSRTFWMRQFKLFSSTVFVPLCVFFRRIKLGVKNELRRISFSWREDRPEMKLLMEDTQSGIASKWNNFLSVEKHFVCQSSKWPSSQTQMGSALSFGKSCEKRCETWVFLALTTKNNGN